MVLPLIAAAIIAFGVVMYVVLDGFDLGVGILFPLVPDEALRDRMMNSIAPVWDGNETWLVLGGTALFGLFPRAYGELLPRLYLPIMVMLFGLVFRGVAFEFRFKSTRRAAWNVAFAAGSVIAAFAQGVVLGTYLNGYGSGGPGMAGVLHRFDVFGLITGLALIAGYALLGATWLALKTEGALEARAWRLARPLVFVVFAFIVVVSLWTALLDPRISARWFGTPQIYFLWLVPAVTGFAGLALLHALATRRALRAFLLGIAIFLMCYLGLGVSLWPMMVPPSLTIFAAATPPQSALFLLPGIAIIIPIILGYTGYNYYVFRGKTAEHEGYEG